LFLFTNAQYISTVLGFANGRPYRKPFYTNISFTVLVVGLYGLAIATILRDDSWLVEFTHVRNKLLLKNINFEIAI